MKVILIQDVADIGKAGEIREVKTGFARNYLLRQNLAVLPGDPKAQDLIKVKEEYHQKEEEKKQKQDDLLAEISGKKFTFKAKTDKKGKLYGSIGPKEIGKATGLDEKLIKEHFKEIGVFNLEIKSSEKNIKIIVEIKKN